MTLRKSFLAEPYYRWLDKRILPYVNRLTLSPNQFTLVGVLLAAAVPIGFFLYPVVGLLFMLISGFVDTLDGLLARRRNAASTFGAFLDSTLDRISDFFYIFGFWTLFWNSDRFILASGLIFASSLTTVMISYVKARSEALGGTCSIGWMERGWRTIYLIIWAFLICVLPPLADLILWAGLVLYFVLTSITVLQRITHSRMEFSRSKG
ncbi:MAG: CDP-alcohol phosphatidyltransferase family protein [Desulfobacterales bacterium]|nr:CDP-alcohol phosphatidyltransferase family protein [Desulfobacterales bacterium]MDP4856161.1 CDP-alcohol phosphatidyltransferase family protein [Desulfobacterales bacterium]